MEKRVLFTELDDRGSHLRKEITPTAVVTDNGKFPAGMFWDANKTMNTIVAGATSASDTLEKAENNLNAEIARATQAEQDISDRIDDILGIDAQDIEDLKTMIEDLDSETGILSVIDSKANKADLGTASTKDVPTSGNASTTEVVMGNDSRLTDARTPVSHTHTKSEITDFPTNVSSFTNDAGYLTQHQSLTDYVQKSQTAGLLKNDGTVDTNTYLTQHQDISGKADSSQVYTKSEIDQMIGTIETQLSNI